MATEPTSADVAQFCEITSLDPMLDRNLVVSALKVRYPLAMGLYEARTF